MGNPGAEKKSGRGASPNRLVGLVFFADLLAAMGAASIGVLFFSMSVRNFALITLVTFGLSLTVVFLILQPIEKET